MKQPHVLVQLACVSVVVLAATAGCNAVLSNEEGTPRTDAGAAPDGGDGGPDLSCDTAHGNKVCFGLCVKIDDPSTGCGDPASCTACDPKNVTASKCVGGTATLTCGFAECQPGFGSCDSLTSTGCETSLNSRKNCGGVRGRLQIPIAALRDRDEWCPPVRHDRSGGHRDLRRGLRQHEDLAPELWRLRRRLPKRCER